MEGNCLLRDFYKSGSFDFIFLFVRRGVGLFVKLVLYNWAFFFFLMLQSA